MRGISFRRPTPAMVVAFCSLVLASAGVVSAHGGDGTIIHACVSPNSSVPNVRIIAAPGVPGDPNAVCSDNPNSPGVDAPLDWNVQGIQGPAGAEGPAGPRGFAGPPGPAGPAGRDGITQVIAKSRGKLDLDGTRFNNVLRIPVEPGQRYWVTASLTSHTFGFQHQVCELSYNNKTLDVKQSFSGDGAGLMQTVAMQGLVLTNLLGAQWLYVNCRDVSAKRPDSRVMDVDLYAAPIDRFHIAP